MQLTTYTTLLLSNSALIASAYVMERGYAQLTGAKYCEDLVAQLNVRFKANIPLGKCANTNDLCDKTTKYGNPSELPCHELVSLAKERGVQVDPSICLSNYVATPNLEATYGFQRVCSGLIEKLKPFQSGLDPSICSRIRTDLGPADLENLEISKQGCQGLVKAAQKLGIKVSSSICRGMVVGISNKENSELDRYPRFSENEGDNVCPNIASRLHDLGYKVDMQACLKIKIVTGPSREVINNMTCEEIVTHAKALRIVKGDIKVCQGKPHASENFLAPGGIRRSACEGLVTRLRGIGVDLKPELCSNV
ncbi:hypothetical protein K493DRAFT_302082 [Basidiobolus meristosporus CBS 931.73]|uniref:Uncharacterized protein n=1 Tax=Basidiobolus meristosporus CBS 931.73 TaxID=1314790 RepID=A0A1Y1Y8T7_9FUNG|nr:hypothetical protein K493DRAFT_302082 [Basidiobolus meristosporus CBS 931.73]|eukprot:ORX94413.1 hypothetical protein K493DRAFT_302082 [Basidiobolus meristosporus CBS 931.73]